MFTSKEFWSATGERALKTVAQALLATLALGSTVWGVDWYEALGIGLLAGVISILTSISDPRVGREVLEPVKPETPSEV